LSFGPMHTNYDIASNGRFLAPVASEGTTPSATIAIRQIDVVLNWQEELKQRVPTR